MNNEPKKPDIKIYMKPELAGLGTEILIDSLQKGQTAALFIREDIPTKAPQAPELDQEQAEEITPEKLTEENAPF